MSRVANLAAFYGPPCGIVAPEMKMQFSAPIFWNYLPQVRISTLSVSAFKTFSYI